MLVHASTVVSRSAGSLLGYLSRLPTRFREHTLLFALYAGPQNAGLQEIVDHLTSISPRSLGCLSAQLPFPDAHNHISCAIAIFDNRHSIIFRSELPGKPSVQVGRWHAFRKKEDTRKFDTQYLQDNSSNIDWEDVWNRSAGSYKLPPELRELSPAEVGAVLYLSDSATEGLMNALSDFCEAPKLGLVASSTPFITGRPVTLFRSHDVFSSGAVGIVLTKMPPASVQTLYPGLVPLSVPMTVTKYEGNLITELDGQNPTQLLLSAIRNLGMGMTKTGVFKDDEHPCLGTFTASNLRQMFNIIAGDPSRGPIALESDRAPKHGTTVQFFYRPKAASSEIKQLLADPGLNGIRFLTSTEMPFHAPGPFSEVLSNTFLASSENGFVLGPSKEDPVAWKCTVPGSVASITLPALPGA